MWMDLWSLAWLTEVSPMFIHLRPRPHRDNDTGAEEAKEKSPGFRVSGLDLMTMLMGVLADH